MGIYIKGMKMPKNCRECFACKAELSQEKKVIYVCCFAMADCPLVSIPPHGDLIDRNALMKGEGRYIISFGKEGIDVAEINRAPTIIEAEED